VFGVRQSLCPHDYRVHDAGPYHEPDKARVRMRVATGNQQKYSQRCIDAQNHLQVVRHRTGVPDPPGWPNKAKGVNPNMKVDPLTAVRYVSTSCSRRQPCSFLWLLRNLIAALAGTSRLHRLAAYTRCLRCAYSHRSRRPTTGSELSLMLFHNMSSSETTGNFPAAYTQSFAENTGLRLGIKVSAFPSSSHSDSGEVCVFEV